MNRTNDTKIDITALLTRYHKNNKNVNVRTFKAALVGNSEALICIDGCTQTQQIHQDTNIHSPQLKMPSCNFNFEKDKNELQQYSVNLNGQADRESSVPESTNVYSNSAFSNDHVKTPQKKSLHSETFYKLNQPTEPSTDNLTSSATYTNHQVKTRRRKCVEKMTYCRPVINLFNQEFIYKTMEKQRKLQRLVKQLIEARKREKQTVWDTYIRDLKIKHGMISDRPGPSSIGSPIQVPSFRTAEQILEDYYNTKYAPAESFHCKDLLKDIYDSNIMHPDRLMIALHKNKGVNTEDAKCTSPNLYKSNPYFCYPTASQACLRKYGRYNCHESCESAAGLRPFLTGPHHFHGAVDTRKYLGNYIYIPLAKKKRRKLKTKTGVTICDCEETEINSKRTAGTDTDYSGVSEDNDNVINEVAEMTMLQNQNIQTEVLEPPLLIEKGSYGDQNLENKKEPIVEKLDQNAELGQSVEVYNNMINQRKNIEKTKPEQRSEVRGSTGAQNRNTTRQNDVKRETVGATKSRGQGVIQQRPQTVTDHNEKLNSLKEQYAQVSNNVARLKELNDSRKGNLDNNLLGKIENKLDLLIIAINSLISGINEKEELTLREAKRKNELSRKPLRDAIIQMNTLGLEDIKEVSNTSTKPEQSALPTQQRNKPVEQSTTPTQRPTTPTQQPAMGSKQPSMGSQESKPLTQQPTQAPTQQPTMPSQQSNELTHQPVTPKEQPTVATQQSTTPSKQSAAPTKQPTMPSQQSATLTQLSTMTSSAVFEPPENIVDRIKKTNYRCNMSGCTSARCLMRRKIGEDTVPTAEFFNATERKELIKAVAGSACINKPKDLDSKADGSDPKSTCCRFKNRSVNLAILDNNYDRTAALRTPNDYNFQTEASESFENKTAENQENEQYENTYAHPSNHCNNPFGFTKGDQYICELITDQSTLRFSENYTSDRSSMKIENILSEEMNKSDQAKRDIEEILNGESHQTCAVQISLSHVPTRECCTEVTNSLSKTKVAEDKSVDVIPVTRNKSRRGLSIAVNTDPLSLLALIKISTEAIWRVLTDMHLDCYSFLSLIQSPQVTRALAIREPQYVCDICGAVFRKPSQLSEHIRGHQSGTSRDCCVCRHLLEVRQQRSAGLFICQYCGQCFTRAYCRELHEQKCARRQGQVHDIPESLAILR